MVQVLSVGQIISRNYAVVWCRQLCIYCALYHKDQCLGQGYLFYIQLIWKT